MKNHCYIAFPHFVQKLNQSQLEKNVTEVNNKLKSILGKDIEIIEHANIEMEYLNYSKLHLNKRGTGTLVHNFIQHFKIRERRVFNLRVIDPLHNAAKIDNSVGSDHKLKGVKIMCLDIDSLLKVHSLSSGNVAATPILKSVPSQFSPFIL